MKHRTINLELVHLEVEYDDNMAPVLVCYGSQRTAEQLKVRVHLSTWGADYVAEHLHEIVKKWETRVESLKKALRGG